MSTIHDIARDLVLPGKGILAADESTKSANKRLASVGVPENPLMRRVYREVFLTTPGIGKYLSGVILYDETIRDSTRDGIPFTELLKKEGVYVGIKVDEGTVPFEGGDELVTEGLSGLAERLREYKEMGAVFAKWRAVIRIEGDELPTHKLILENADRLARYAAVCQVEGVVPIAEPEVLLAGDHTRARAAEVIAETLRALIDACEEHTVDLSALIIKSSMVVSGSDSCCTDSPEAVAEDTLASFHDAVPHEVPGIVFLSGGQEADEATDNLRAIAKMGPQPWQLTFSFARALQGEALEVWAGKDENIPQAQKVFMERLMKVARARDGR